MSVKLPDWPKLWAKEPALRPPQLLDMDGAYRAAYSCADPGHAAIWRDASNESATVAALCRDAAVRFLSGRGGLQVAQTRVFILWPSDEAPAGMYCTRFDDQPYLAVRGVTLDESLFVACEAAIEARGAYEP